MPPLVMPWRIVFVCTGNICRSPTAEGVLRRMAAAQGQAGRVEVASAGLEDWHVGAPPDARSQAHAQRRGHELAPLRAKHFTRSDFDRFDWVIAMDAGHHDRLRRPARRSTFTSCAALPISAPASRRGACRTRTTAVRAGSRRCST